VEGRSTATAAFFDRLGHRRHEPMLEGVYGTIRFDLRDEQGTDHWFVQIENGHLRLAREELPAECVVHTDREVFDQWVTGRTRSMPSWLRHEFWVEGNAGLMRIFDRVLPGPAHARHPRDLVPFDRKRR
jgi:hypothetical protein